jgi:hypothetical protein
MELNIQEINNPNIVILNDVPLNPTTVKKTTNPHTKTISPHDEILSKMGMYVENGKISVINKKNVRFSNTNTNNNNNNSNSNVYKCGPKMQCSRVKKMQESIKHPIISDNKNSYIYNKYFKNESQEAIAEPEPLTKEQIIQKLLQNRLQRQRIKQIKSTKLIMPTENIHYAPENNFNRLFGFSNRG